MACRGRKSASPAIRFSFPPDWRYDLLVGLMDESRLATIIRGEIGYGACDSIDMHRGRGHRRMAHRRDYRCAPPLGRRSGHPDQVDRERYDRHDRRRRRYLADDAYDTEKDGCFGNRFFPRMQYLIKARSQ